MKPKSRVIAAATITTFVAIGAGVVAWRAAQAASDAVAARLKFSQEDKALAGRLSTVVARGEAAKQKLAAARSASGAVPGAASAPKPTPPPKRPSSSEPPNSATLERAMEDPKLQILKMAAKRAEVDTSYGPFFRAHGLTAAQADTLRDLLARNDARLDDVVAVSHAHGLRANDPAVVSQRNEAAADLRGAEVALLGDAGYSALQDYERALPVRAYVGALAGLAVLSDLPLTFEQADQLAVALARADPAYASGEKVALARINWSLADAAARNILSPEQWTMFTRVNAPETGQTRFIATGALGTALVNYAQAKSVHPGH
jgi:hypothetical protein